MRFRKIQISHFRNLKSVELTFNSRVNVFFGENAQGKTNLLETIYALTHGRGFRGGEVENLIYIPPETSNMGLSSVDSSVETRDNKSTMNREPDSFARVIAQVERNQLVSQLRLVVTPESKNLFLNEKKISSSAMAKKFSSVLFSPESLAAIKDGDLERRELIDELIVSVFPEQAIHIDNFKKALRQRNKLLKDIRDGIVENNAKIHLYLETLTQHFLKVATELCVARIESIEHIREYLREALCYILDISDVDISVEYVISSQKMNGATASQVYDAMYKRWIELKAAELNTGHSLVGPHKHDVGIIFAGKDSRFYCSQGQQRLIILAFKMAQIRLHYRVHSAYPILLLDDVLSEIDEKKRVRLIEYLETINAQIFMTTTENTVLNYLSRDSLAVYNVENGMIRSALQEDVSVR
jgi:DNA replication and repair protein RecF